MDRVAYHKFWYWIRERQAIWHRRFKENLPPPWTKDKILREFKFTNVFRNQDRVTIDCHRQIRDALADGETLDLILFRVCLYRLFNWPNTYQMLKDLGSAWDEREARKRIARALTEKKQVYTGAYIVPNLGRTDPKHFLMTRTLSQIWKRKEDIVEAIKNDNTLEGACAILRAYESVGPFISYEIVTDLRWTPLLKNADDIMSWANPGPGAKRGLDRIFRGIGFTKGGRPDRKYRRPNVKQYVEEMRKLLVASASIDTLGKDFKRLEMRDIEHSLCEFDKYMRVLRGEGRPRSKYHADHHSQRE